METRPYVIFEIRDTRYGLPSEAVVQIFSLPELVPVAEMPPYVAGLIDVAGSIVPILDLGLRLGLGPWQPRLRDVVILFRLDGTTFGVIVDDVLDVRLISSSEPPPYPPPIDGVRFVSGVSTADGELIGLIDPEILLRHSEAIADLEGHSIDLEQTSTFAPEADQETRSIFRERARALASGEAVPEAETATGLMLFELAGELYAITLDVVREVAELREVSPVPCTSEKIVGLMNLRGDIVTLVSIAAAIGSGHAAPASRQRAIIVQCGPVRAGLIVDDVREVVHLSVDASGAAPVEGSFVRGTVAFDNRIYVLLDVAAMFDAGVFEVVEEVAG
jgi:purine-binding chemotaxis protein CheW